MSNCCNAEMLRWDCRQLFIGNLGPHTSEDALKWAFRNYNIIHVKLVREYVTDPRMAGTGDIPQNHKLLITFASDLKRYPELFIAAVRADNLPMVTHICLELVIF